MTSPPARILIVDDDISTLKSLSELLRHDYQVSVARAAAQALVLLKKDQKPDLILMDIMMPDISGIEICKQLQSDPRTAKIPLIFITSLSSPKDESEALAVGAVDFITKPISPPNVLLRVGLHIQLQQQKQALQAKNKALESERTQIAEILEKMHSRYTPDTSRLAYICESIERNSGDIVLSVNTPRGYYCLVGDFTGHGLPAAVGGPALARVFMDCIQRACFSPGQLLQQLNYELYSLLPTNVFLCAAFIYIDPLSDIVSIWNAGLPPQYLVDDDIIEIESTSPPLGITIEMTSTIPSLQTQLSEHRQLFLYTDGLVEGSTTDDEMFGNHRVRAWIEAAKKTDQLENISALLDKLKLFSNGRDLDDDVTIARVSLNPASLSFSPNRRERTRALKGKKFRQPT